MNKLTSQLLLDIIRTEMQLDASALWVRDQNRVIPNDTGLYVIAGMVSAQTISNHTYMITDNAQQKQITRVHLRESIQIDVIGRTNDVLTRNWEVIGALQSFYAQQVQENNNFKIAYIPQSFTNTSAAEGGSILNRYSIVVPCLVWHEKEKDLPVYDYYNDFTHRVDDDKTIGTDKPLFTFEIQ